MKENTTNSLKDILAKVTEFACYDKKTGWECPCFKYEIECDGDCKQSIISTLRFEQKMYNQVNN